MRRTRSPRPTLLPDRHPSGARVGGGVLSGTLTDTASVALAVTLAASLAGCSADTTSPAHAEIADAVDATVLIGSTGDSLQRQIAREYADSLRESGRTVETTVVDAGERVDLLRNGELTMVTGCVGELLDTLDAAKGRELRGLYRKAEAEDTADPATWRDITHSTMVSALPTDLQAADPGLAVACGDDSLPQNNVVLYRKTTMDRKDRKALNDVAGGVSTAELRTATGT